MSAAQGERKMPTREHIVAVIDEYCRAMTAKDKSAWTGQFADNILHEDPVGARTNQGLDQISAFWDSYLPYDIELFLTAPTIVCGSEAIAFMKARTGPADARNETGQIIENFKFDEAGKIANVRAFYDY
jgi:hypothetical protein